MVEEQVRFSNSGSSLWSADTSVTVGDWTLYSFTFTGNGTKFKPYLEFGKSAVGTYYIDDVVLYETSSLGIDDTKNQKNNKAIYPNPAKDVLNLDVAMFSDAKTISIYDLSGKMLKTQKVSANSGDDTISVSNLQTGNYLLMLKSDQGMSVSKVIIK